MTTEKKKPKLGEGPYHPSARPMKVYFDDGIVYLCDEKIDPSKPLKEQASCWTCDKVLFTRGG